MFTVLIVCTGNICRSPMAAGLLMGALPSDLKAHVEVRSAGTYALHGNGATPEAIAAASHFGADIGGHRARLLSKDMLLDADLILAMEAHHLKTIRSAFLFRRAPVHLLGSFDPRGGPEEIDDPYGEPLEAYMRAARRILTCLPGVISEISRRLKR
jgi:protein-tyrosine-phosphatase